MTTDRARPLNNYPLQPSRGNTRPVGHQHIVNEQRRTMSVAHRRKCANGKAVGAALRICFHGRGAYRSARLCRLNKQQRLSLFSSHVRHRSSAITRRLRRGASGTARGLLSSGRAPWRQFSANPSKYRRGRFVFRLAGTLAKKPKSAAQRCRRERRRGQRSGRCCPRVCHFQPITGRTKAHPSIGNASLGRDGQLVHCVCRSERASLKPSRIKRAL